MTCTLHPGIVGAVWEPACLRLLAEWFREQGVQKVCVGIANDSPPEAKPFVEHHGTTPLTKHWYAWEEIGPVAR